MGNSEFVIFVRLDWDSPVTYGKAGDLMGARELYHSCRREFDDCDVTVHIDGKLGTLPLDIHIPLR